jgi:hypothetical protein
MKTRRQTLTTSRLLFLTAPSLITTLALLALTGKPMLLIPLCLGLTLGSLAMSLECAALFFLLDNPRSACKSLYADGNFESIVAMLIESGAVNLSEQPNDQRNRAAADHVTISLTPTAAPVHVIVRPLSTLSRGPLMHVGNQPHIIPVA